MRVALSALSFIVLLTACSERSETPAQSTATTVPTTTPPPPDPVVVAAADVASCNLSTDERTAEVVERYPEATVLVPGDLAYESGTAAEFRDCYGAGWGRFRDRTRPAPGNHEFISEGAGPYFDYFGAAVGERGKGWYSFDLGAWHIVSLNSNCELIGCAPGSEQGTWLAADLAGSKAKCKLAFWHHPRWSSGQHGSQPEVEQLWAAAARGGVDVVLNGHDHDYERFAEIDGVRQFVVGTGGASRFGFTEPVASSEVRAPNALGVLVLTLRPESYDWEFANAETGAPLDERGTESCS